MEVNMQSDVTSLIERIALTTRPIGFYDAPLIKPFAPLVTPEQDACVFSVFDRWIGGQTLFLSPGNCGCSGAGRWLCGAARGTREELVDFLIDEEGLKASKELMNHWLEGQQGYQPEHPNLLIGPLRRGQYRYLRSVTFYVTPDQLGALVLGAHYHSSPGDLSPVIVPFGMGCMQLAALFEDLDAPQAIIGAMDVTIRQSFPPSILAFTVTRPMFDRLCALDEGSFLYKPFLDDLWRARKGPAPAGPARS
jgi:hypothetical protein